MLPFVLTYFEKINEKLHTTSLVLFLSRSSLPLCHQFVNNLHCFECIRCAYRDSYQMISLHKGKVPIRVPRQYREVTNTETGNKTLVQTETRF